MNVLIVTSSVSYVPENYTLFLQELTQRVPHHLKGLLLLKVPFFKMLKPFLGLLSSGCLKSSFTIFQNALGSSSNKKRETLFAQLNVPILHTKDANELWVLDWIQNQKIDLIVNARTRCIYKTPLLKAPRLGCINIHHGLLPSYRGTLCDLWALAEGRPSGYTIHMMTPKIDDGSILSQEIIPNGFRNMDSKIRIERPECTKGYMRTRESAIFGDQISKGEGYITQNTGSDYMDYLKASSVAEGKALASLIEKIAKAESLDGLPNICENPIYCKSPTWMEMLHMRKRGILS